MEPIVQNLMTIYALKNPSREPSLTEEENALVKSLQEVIKKTFPETVSDKSLMTNIKLLIKTGKVKAYNELCIAILRSNSAPASATAAAASTVTVAPTVTPVETDPKTETADIQKRIDEIKRQRGEILAELQKYRTAAGLKVPETKKFLVTQADTLKGRMEQLEGLLYQQQLIGILKKIAQFSSTMKTLEQELTTGKKGSTAASETLKNAVGQIEQVFTDLEELTKKVGLEGIVSFPGYPQAIALESTIQARIAEWRVLRYIE